MKTQPNKTPGAQIIDDAKAKEKQSKETNMKNLTNNQTFKTIRTVFLTVLTIAVLAVYGFYAAQFGASQERDKYESVKAEVKALTTTAPSKQ